MKKSIFLALVLTSSLPSLALAGAYNEPTYRCFKMGDGTFEFQKTTYNAGWWSFKSPEILMSGLSVDDCFRLLNSALAGGCKKQD